MSVYKPRKSRRLVNTRINDGPSQSNVSSLQVAVASNRGRSASESDSLQLITTEKSASSVEQNLLSTSHEIVMRNSSSSTMVLHDRSTRQLSVYQVPVSGHCSPENSSRNRDVCPFCLRPLFGFGSPAGNSNEEMHFKFPHTHVHDYFSRLGQMHLLERPEELPSDEHLSQQSFNSGYYSRFFSEQQKLGSGGYGSVYLCSHLLDGVTLGTYACKKIPVGDNRPWLNRVLSEVRAVESLRHPNIVAYKHSWLEVTQTADFGPQVPVMFMLMEYANIGNVFDYVNNLFQDNGKLLAEADVWSLFSGITQGLRHLHHAGIVHRDLKPENLLLNADFDVVSDCTTLRIIISDFGESETLKAVHRRPRTGNTGTLFFCAPELLLENADYGDRADIYSLGIVLFFLAFGRTPFEDSADKITSPLHLHQLLESGSLTMPFPVSAKRDPELISLIKKLTSFKSEDRPSIDEVLQHPRLRHIGQSHVAFKEASGFSKSNVATALLIGGSPNSSFNMITSRQILPYSLSIMHSVALVLHHLNSSSQPSSAVRSCCVTLLGCATIVLASPSISLGHSRLQCIIAFLESAVSCYPTTTPYHAILSFAISTLQYIAVSFHPRWTGKKRK